MTTFGMSYAFTVQPRHPKIEDGAARRGIVFICEERSRRIERFNCEARGAKHPVQRDTHRGIVIDDIDRLHCRRTLNRHALLAPETASENVNTAP